MNKYKIKEISKVDFLILYYSKNNLHYFEIKIDLYYKKLIHNIKHNFNLQ